MRIRNLMTFTKIAELNSFHGAAKALQTTQPAISARIAALEADLGTSLFRRDKGGTQLTSRGRQLLPFAQKLVRISEEMRAQLDQNLTDGDSVRIGIADTLAQLWVAPLLKQWRLDFPHMQFEVVVDISDHLIKQLENHQLDMVLIVSQSNNNVFMSEHLCSYPQVWVASNEVIQQQNWQNKTVGLEQLAQCSILSFPKHTQPWQDLDRMFSILAEKRPMLHTCSSVSHLMNLTEQGLGVALLPEPLAQLLIGQRSAQIINAHASVKPSELNFCCGWRFDDERVLPTLLAATAREVIAPRVKNQKQNLKAVRHVG
ncbi:LysR family transcriptional regulator [Bermanella sp. R86510]|uniref:LysR family transcriptional regulator n=1 Tax=unclassified Bermanella TaxID=2627862 RepID=UPI0037C664A5